MIVPSTSVVQVLERQSQKNGEVMTIYKLYTCIKFKSSLRYVTRLIMLRAENVAQG